MPGKPGPVRVAPKLLGPFHPVPPSRAAQNVAASVDLDFPIQIQAHDNWCWAAVAAGVATYYARLAGQPAIMQCAVATQFLRSQFAPNTNLCNEPIPEGADHPLALGGVLYRLGLLAGKEINGEIGFDDIVREIQAKRPVCCHIGYADDDGHFLVIAGYNAGTREIRVCDPAKSPEHGMLLYQGRTTFRGGPWDQTYLTQPKADG
jgi:hypothetical protein